MNVVYIIVIALFLIFKVVIKIKSPEEQPSDEALPPNEPMMPKEDEEAVPQPAPAPARKVEKPMPQKPLSHVPLAVEPEEKQEKPVKKERTSYAIKGKTDAKRAIIYSEIFKRKF